MDNMEYEKFIPNFSRLLTSILFYILLTKFHIFRNNFVLELELER